MDLPLGKAKCINCHAIHSESDAYSIGGHGPVCESCTNVLKNGFTINGDSPEICKLFEGKVPPKKG